MNKSNKEPEHGSLDWHIENYQGPLYWLKADGLESVPDLLLTQHNTRIYRFVDSELDRLEVDDLAQEGIVWVLRAKHIGAAILDSLESKDFPILRKPLPDAITEEIFVKQEFVIPPGGTDLAPNLPSPTHH